MQSGHRESVQGKQGLHSVNRGKQSRCKFIRDTKPRTNTTAFQILSYLIYLGVAASPKREQLGKGENWGHTSFFLCTILTRTVRSRSESSPRRRRPENHNQPTMSAKKQKVSAEERVFLFSSESVNEGHPDKLADQVSDAVLDACLTEDPMSKVRTRRTVGLSSARGAHAHGRAG